MLTLYGAPGACSVIPHIALEEAGADYAVHFVDYAGGETRTPGFRALSPLGRVPMLMTEDGPLTENPAILSYIAMRYPAAGLAPLGDALAFARVQSFNLFIASNIHVAFRQIAFPDGYADGEAAAAALRAKVPELADRYFAIIERGLADGRPFVLGDSYTLSDIYLFAYANYLRMGDRGDPACLPLIMAHRARVRARPAVDRALVSEGLADAWAD
ncbi:glutathione S-transferase [Sphingomonas laterariae]|uniref:Glutathione S-transferase n=1 Tax=Edaphosphingomonas laterariae TaxID=861865 RepID=A0A239ELK3_9SPHN|nr:glutathione S-transferase C-terminal domain-containing protein [Sphingomonas laterariae]SNS44913.1 glutathione S-transferase [Sphingomonas laterariae]